MQTKTGAPKTVPLVLLRHGESQWNLENRFTGWTDVDLTEKGREEARAAGRLMKSEGFDFDRTHTSVLKRAMRTHWLALEEMDRLWLPVERNWRLNERHYGGLQGLDKSETAAKYGEAQVKIWRRSFDTPPPALEKNDPRVPSNDPRYRGLAPRDIPLTESLKDTIARFKPHWEDVLIPQIREGLRLLMVAHGNSLRALVKILDGVSDADIVELNIPTGIPLLYELECPPSGGVRAVSHRYLGDAEAAQKAAQAVANQSKSKK